MNLTSFGLSNFKAFGPSLQQMPLKPLTLIFGPNSAGKSSLLHGLLWTTEVVMQDRFDIHTSKRVSGTLDLGGFLSVLRGHNPANKIRISIGLGNCLSGEPIQLNYEIGIRTDDDASEIFQREWIDSDSEMEKIEEFKNAQKVMRVAYDLFNEIFDWQYPGTEEVEKSLASKVAWDERVEQHRRLAITYESTAKKSFPTWKEAKAMYLEAQKAWSRRRELAPSIIPRLQNLWQRFTDEKLKEIDGCSVISCEVQLGDRTVLKAFRGIGSQLLTIDPLSFNSAEWEKLPIDDFHQDSRRTQQANSGQAANCIGTVEFALPPTAEESHEKMQVMLDRAIQWLLKQRNGLSRLLDHLIFVGPLRALPSRRELLGFPNEMVTDPLLLPWQRLRDDSTVRDSVNKTLKTLTKSDLSFCRIAYGKIERVARIEENLPERFIGDLVADGPEPTDWNEPRFMEGFVRFPAETMISKPGPFYGELKDEDPDAAVQMIEEHLTKKFPQEILFDLLLRDGRSGVDVKPQDVGVGISQIAPVLVQAFGNKETFIAIEQPEIHIHPALQAELADVFIESALGENKNTFLLETHSEHLILRILRRIRETTRGTLPEGVKPVKPEDVAVLYVEPGKEGSVVRELRVNDQGRFIDDWPNGFFEERFNEEF